MNNWKEYIDKITVPRQDFSFDTEEVSNTLIITHNKTQTKLYFIWPTENWAKLGDIQFHNARTEGWSGEFYGDLIFSNDTVKQVDRFLEPAFTTGWTSKDIYLFGRHFKSEVAWNLQNTGKKFYYFSSETGCLSLILFPVFYAFSLLAKIGIIGSVKTIKIDPINN